MKRWIVRSVVIVGLLVAIWFLYVGPVSVRWRQNNASVDMLVTKNKLEQYVRDKGEWPQSWQDLFPEGMTSAHWSRDVSRTVKVNWQASVDQAVDFFERLDPKHREQMQAGIDPPIFVGYTDRVPRNDDLVSSERRWNWMIAQSLYKEHGGKVSSP